MTITQKSRAEKLEALDRKIAAFERMSGNLQRKLAELRVERK